MRPGSPKPGRIQRIDGTRTGEDDFNKNDDPVITQRFLKINVRHITDGQGVVGGVLLVTPNAVMFDPNVSDPLVIEHGPESYGVIAPIELCVNAAIFNDIAHMRVSGGPGGARMFGNTPTAFFGGGKDSADDIVIKNSNDKPEIYYPKAVLEMGTDVLTISDEEDKVDKNQQQQSADSTTENNDVTSTSTKPTITSTNIVTVITTTNECNNTETDAEKDINLLNRVENITIPTTTDDHESICSGSGSGQDVEVNQYKITVYFICLFKNFWF